MSLDYARRFPTDFPRLGNRYKKKSDNTDRYNCIAWAMSECHRPWWPGCVEPAGYWPPTLSEEETIENFIDAFRQKGYELCVGAHHEWRFEKIAIYADRTGVPTHAARQSWSGIWFSKLGQNVDISHRSLDALAQGLYGTVVQTMKRPWTRERLVTAVKLSLKTSTKTARFFRKPTTP